MNPVAWLATHGQRVLGCPSSLALPLSRPPPPHLLLHSGIAGDTAKLYIYEYLAELPVTTHAKLADVALPGTHIASLEWSISGKTPGVSLRLYQNVHEAQQFENQTRVHASYTSPAVDKPSDPNGASSPLGYSYALEYLDWPYADISLRQGLNESIASFDATKAEVFLMWRSSYYDPSAMAPLLRARTLGIQFYQRMAASAKTYDDDAMQHTAGGEDAVSFLTPITSPSFPLAMRSWLKQAKSVMLTDTSPSVILQLSHDDKKGHMVVAVYVDAIEGPLKRGSSAPPHHSRRRLYLHQLYHSLRLLCDSFHHDNLRHLDNSPTGPGDL